VTRRFHEHVRRRSSPHAAAPPVGRGDLADDLTDECAQERARRDLEQLDEALSTRPLSNADIAELERLVPRDRVVGSRYGEAQMKQHDSER
jgi:hypothetical protein